MAPDVAAQKGIGNVASGIRAKHFLDGSADIARGVHQRAVNVEEVNGKCRDLIHAARLRPAADALRPVSRESGVHLRAGWPASLARGCAAASAAPWQEV